MDDIFLSIFHEYKDDIYRLVFSYTKNFTDAEDITQNVFIKLYKHNKILKLNEVEIKKWLVRVAINECKSFFSSFWKKKISFLNQDDEEKLVSSTKNNSVLLEVLNLPEKYRITIYLYYYENYKIKEISKFLKISETNIQTILYRARNMLKEKLKGEWNYE